MRWIGCLLLLSLGGPVPGQSRLQRAGGLRLPEAPSPPRTPQPSPPQPPPRDAYSNTSGLSGEGAEGIAALALAAVAGPFVVPHWACEDSLSADGRFPNYPYEGARCGYMWVPQSCDRP